MCAAVRLVADCRTRPLPALSKNLRKIFAIFRKILAPDNFDFWVSELKTIYWHVGYSYRRTDGRTDRQDP